MAIDHRTAGLAEVRAAARVGLVEIPPQLHDSIAAVARLSERQRDLRRVIDDQSAYLELADRFAHAARQPGGRWPEVQPVLDVQDEERRRQVAARVVGAAIGRALGDLDAALDDAAADLIHALDASLQKVVTDPKVLADADALVPGEDPAATLARGGEATETYLRLRRAITERVLVATAAWNALLARTPPVTCPVEYRDVIVGGMHSIWRRPLLVAAGAAQAPWVDETDSVAMWHFFLKSRTSVKLRTGRELDADAAHVVAKARAQRTAAAGV